MKSFSREEMIRLRYAFLERIAAVKRLGGSVFFSYIEKQIYCAKFCDGTEHPLDTTQLEKLEIAGNIITDLDLQSQAAVLSMIASIFAGEVNQYIQELQEEIMKRQKSSLVTPVTMQPIGGRPI